MGKSSPTVIHHIVKNCTSFLHKCIVLEKTKSTQKQMPRLQYLTITVSQNKQGRHWQIITIIKDIFLP